jgi:pyoverdine/dityrosine biosynthesis protein Dit1
MTSIQTPQSIAMVDNKANEAASVQVMTTEISDLSVSEHETPNQHEATATKVLRIIEQYGLNYERTGAWDGFETFLPVVLGQITRGESVKMPNSRDKVLSNLPDLGEELALKHLNGLCENIKAVYDHGAEIHITSDGLVYNGTFL